MSRITGLGAQMSPWLEHAWLQRYLDGDLEPREVEAFETYLLGRPHLVAEVEADNQLRAAIAADPALLLEVRGTDAPPAVREPRPGYRLPKAWMSLAAGLVLGVGVAGLGLPGFVGSGSGVLVPPRIIYDTLRGELSAPREEPGDPSSPIRLYELPLPAGATIVAAEAVQRGRHIDLPVATPAADGYLTYGLPASWRGQGELNIDITFADGRSAGARLIFPL